MAELEIDQSHLPRVQEVRQNFAVLEDGVLAHSLQEQEIEKYYMSNIQKNQLVQNDIRMAKQLQDEEEARNSALLRQTSRQLEEQDFEYARVIQEEIQRCAEEARRRELDDEELAKQIQEEEEQRGRITREASSSGSDLSLPQHHSHHGPHSQEQYPPVSSRGQRSTSDYFSSQLDCPQAGSPRGLRTNPRLRSSEGRSFRDCGECLSEESDGSDAVFSECSSCRTKRDSRLGTVPPPHQPRERNYRSLISHSRSFPEYNYERDHSCEKGCVERRRDRNHNVEKYYREEYNGWHRNQEQERELSTVRERRCSRTESVRLPDRHRKSFREAAKTWAYNDNPDKHVRFRDDSSKAGESSSQARRTESVWEMLGQVLRERGVPVRLGSNGAPLQIGAPQRTERRDSQTLYGSEASCSDTQPHQRAFERAVTARHSFHGDIHERRRSAQRNAINGVQTPGKDYEHVQPDQEIRRRDSNFSRQGSRRWKEQKSSGNDDSHVIDHRIRRTTSERRTHGSSEERDMERPERRAPHRSQSLISRHRPPAERDRTSLELGELQQVLHDEELARKLQEEEEERLTSGIPRPSPRNSYPEGDFKVAQVAQDEEIARYIQKQEIKTKRRSRELEGPVSWREHRAMMSQHDRRARERQVPRERLDSEGLPSPMEDFSPEEPPHSPTSTLPPSSHIKNIAEELDPTFQAQRPAPESLRAAQNDSSCAPLPAQQSGFLEEPTFVPPTKRQAEKSVRPKSKEKRENCKQQ
uniref:Coiled-coil domain containing 187 n=1 Tax=Neogobius melanostomus TaxID=47308 RepID=A0A8C6V2N7_9GOBI